MSEITYETIHSTLEAAEFAAENYTSREAALASLARARVELEQLTRQTVDDARDQGASWELVGMMLGISKQGAQQRYGRTQRRPGAGAYDVALPLED